MDEKLIEITSLIIRMGLVKTLAAKHSLGIKFAIGKRVPKYIGQENSNIKLKRKKQSQL